MHACMPPGVGGWGGFRICISCWSIPVPGYPSALRKYTDVFVGALLGNSVDVLCSGKKATWILSGMSRGKNTTRIPGTAVVCTLSRTSLYAVRVYHILIFEFTAVYTIFPLWITSYQYDGIDAASGTVLVFKINLWRPVCFVLRSPDDIDSLFCFRNSKPSGRVLRITCK